MASFGLTLSSSKFMIISIALMLIVPFLCTPTTSSESESESESKSEAAFIKKTISSHSIVIFSKSYCPYCKRAKAVFKELNQTPHVIELDQREFHGLIFWSFISLTKKLTRGALLSSQKMGGTFRMP
ncbi:glutaredoxin-C4-like isoform X2 [Camellia sinensis]|uniref:glutaredoxin-C4-like isoform X2 n=1 Tax=Camellia sinensis TaxID=4442 RepID=UPI001036E889|nr:glutaredoxin-C4-like isoform X2 [Camellia sinensis]